MVKRGQLHGEDIIILEEHPQCFVWIPEAHFDKTLQELGLDVKDDLELAEKTLKQHIKDSGAGWEKYRPALRELGIDV